MSRIKFNTTNEYDFVNNYKILQSVFNKHKIERNVPIDKLVKCRYQDNLEFLQWMKKYWDAFYPGGRYDAAARRNITTQSRTTSPVSPGSTLKRSPSTTSSNASVTRLRPGSGGAASGVGKGGMSSSRNGQQQQAPGKLRALSMASDDSWGGSSSSHMITQPSEIPQHQSKQSVSPSHTLQQQQETLIRNLDQQVGDLKIAADTLERERNFYYLKLRDLEVLVLEKLDSPENIPFLHEIQTILYATEEGFIRPNKRNPPKLALAPISVTVPRATTATSLASPLRSAAPIITPNTAPVAYAMTTTRRSSLGSLLSIDTTTLDTAEPPDSQPHSADTEVASSNASPAGALADRISVTSPSRSASVMASAGTNSGTKPQRPSSVISRTASRSASVVKRTESSAPTATVTENRSPSRTASRSPSVAKRADFNDEEYNTGERGIRGSTVQRVRAAVEAETATASVEFGTTGAGVGE
ncbi:hypothetical protein HDU98_012255 [Podochytrium sp. JEL0797]|nr:hypothetical protein HDU98_012255 [Podochytrium sp. JEL0797]